MALRRNNSLSPRPRSPAFNHLHSRPARLVQPAGRTQHQLPHNIRPAPMRAACRGRSPGTPGRTSPGLVQPPLRTHAPRPFPRQPATVLCRGGDTRRRQHTYQDPSPDNQQQFSAGAAIRGAGVTRAKTLPQTTSNRPLPRTLNTRPSLLRLRPAAKYPLTNPSQTTPQKRRQKRPS